MEVTSIEAIQQLITKAEVYDKQCIATSEKLNQKSGDVVRLVISKSCGFYNIQV